VVDEGKEGERQHDQSAHIPSLPGERDARYLKLSDGTNSEWNSRYVKLMRLLIAGDAGSAVLPPRESHARALRRHSLCAPDIAQHRSLGCHRLLTWVGIWRLRLHVARGRRVMLADDGLGRAAEVSWLNTRWRRGIAMRRAPRQWPLSGEFPSDSERQLLAASSRLAAADGVIDRVV